MVSKPSNFVSKFQIREMMGWIAGCSPADMCMTCAIYDKSMTFDTNGKHINVKIFGYRAISGFALEGVGGLFQDGRRKLFLS